MSNGRSGREPQLTQIEVVRLEAARLMRWAEGAQTMSNITNEQFSYYSGFKSAMGEIVKLSEIIEKLD